MDPRRRHPDVPNDPHRVVGEPEEAQRQDRHEQPPRALVAIGEDGRDDHERELLPPELVVRNPRESPRDERERQEDPQARPEAAHVLDGEGDAASHADHHRSRFAVSKTSRKMASPLSAVAGSIVSAG